MKTNRRELSTQRQLIEKRLRAWSPVQDSAKPPSGWIRAVRGALGLSTRQLALRLGTNHSAVVALEKRETQGKASLEMIERAARAMGCKLVYAIVPEAPGQTLDGILTERARARATGLLSRVEHSMQLEKQGSTSDDAREQIERLASELKNKMDPTIWDQPIRGRKKLPQ